MYNLRDPSRVVYAGGAVGGSDLIVGAPIIPEKEKQMSAYVVTHVHVHDRDKYDEFLAAAMPLFKKWGGEIEVGSSECTALEGECPSRVVVQRFPDSESARGLLRE